MGSHIIICRGPDIANTRTKDSINLEGASVQVAGGCEFMVLEAVGWLSQKGSEVAISTIFLTGSHEVSGYSPSEGRVGWLGS